MIQKQSPQPGIQRRLAYRILADTLLAIHVFVIFLLLFGWLFSSLRLWYLAALLLTFASEVALGYCFLGKWEFWLRKRVEPRLPYNGSFITYYLEKYFKVRVSSATVQRAVLIFLCVSLILNFVYAHP